MTASPIQTVLNALRIAGCEPKPHGKGYRARCPGRDDRNPSLDVDIAADGKVLLIDRGKKATVTEILSAIGLKPADLFPAKYNGHRRSEKNSLRGLSRSPKRYPNLDAAVTAAARMVAGVEVGRFQYSEVFWTARKF